MSAAAAEPHERLVRAERLQPGDRYPWRGREVAVVSTRLYPGSVLVKVDDVRVPGMLSWHGFPRGEQVRVLRGAARPI